MKIADADRDSADAAIRAVQLRILRAWDGLTSSEREERRQAVRNRLAYGFPEDWRLAHWTPPTPSREDRQRRWAEMHTNSRGLAVAGTSRSGLRMKP